MERTLPLIFQSTTDRERLVRIGISLALIMPLGFVLGFAFPTGLRMVSDVNPPPCFWGINGATSVLASVLAVMFSMSFGINVTMVISAACYLLLVSTSYSLLDLNIGTMRQLRTIKWTSSPTNGKSIGGGERVAPTALPDSSRFCAPPDFPVL